ncbi:hypothetical protein M378DRAFT_13035 [Amanita muscaria Koide BX008]|uniref:Dolichyl-diphosphooligosaccharide-protein glycosyltransferase subunit OST5 n=1 Tax=Amanita muscaria (strain Koide BX008) TaxID=946122 RepID=A0A0C2T6J4_AMAMK|nr:hypothetical protein M378DRAFT_13035 [Amanita muscaria Koide BX008]
MADHHSIKVLYTSLPAFSPVFPPALLPYLAFLLLAVTFTLAFYFSTLPKDNIPVRESTVASAASLLGGFGVVALFCSVGVYI